MQNDVGGVVPQNDLPANLGGPVPSSDLPSSQGPTQQQQPSGSGGGFSNLVQDFRQTGIPNELLRIGSKVIGGVGHSIGDFAREMLLPGATINEKGITDLAQKELKEGKLSQDQVNEITKRTHRQAVIDAAVQKWTDPGNFLDWFRQNYTTPPSTNTGRIGENVASMVTGFMLPIPGAAKGEVEADLAQALPEKLSGDRQLGASMARVFGYKVAPSEQEGHIIGKEVQGLAGVPHTEMSISDKNVERASDDVRQDLGLSEGAPLDPDTYHNVRSMAGDSYDEARNLKDFTADNTMKLEASRLGADALEFEETHPTSYKPQTIAEINRLRNMFLTPSGENWSGAHAIQGVKLLRAQARNAFRAASDDPEPDLVAGLRKQAADILEGGLARAADNQGFPKLGQDIRSARRLIAKSYEAESATVGGRIDPQALRLAHKHGAPLDGAMLRIAQLADMFPKSFRSPRTLTKMGAQSGRWFTRMAAIGGMLAHNPKLALLYAAQTGAKHLAESDLFQPEKVAERVPNKALEFIHEKTSPRIETKSARSNVRIGAATATAADSSVDNAD